ncbi:MAG: hypothetical protein EXR35_05970 [Limnohabitans sp.]|nr:hypothetical protein [Limnohabitans sp.]
MCGYQHYCLERASCISKYFSINAGSIAMANGSVIAYQRIYSAMDGVFSFGGFVLVYFFLYLLQTNFALRLRFHAHLLNIPLLGFVLQLAAVDRWTHTLSVLVQTGVPWVEALHRTGEATQSVLYQWVTIQIKDSVLSGSALSTALSHPFSISATYALPAHRLFPHDLIQMIATGEESGSLDTFLSASAHLLDQRLAQALTSLTLWMEPFLVVFLGLLNGGVIISLYLSILQLGQVI